MLKILFEYLVDSYTLLENPIHNYIIMGVIGLLAYLVAYGIVGWFYNEKVISKRGEGHVLHWSIRFLVFMLIYYIIATMIRIYKWVVGVPVYVWWIVGIATTMLGVIVLLIKYMVGRKNINKKCEKTSNGICHID